MGYHRSGWGTTVLDERSGWVTTVLDGVLPFWMDIALYGSKSPFWMNRLAGSRAGPGSGSVLDEATSAKVSAPGRREDGRKRFMQNS